MKQLLRRFTSLVAVLVIVTLAITFMVTQMPGDPAYVILGENATPEQVQVIHEQLGLDESFWTRYVDWIGGAVQGDFGTSLRTGEDVSSAILSRFPVTLELMILAQIIALVLAIPMALYSAFHHRRLVDRASAGFSFACISVAPFVTAIALIWVFAVKLNVLPASGYVPFEDGLWQNLRAMILPAFSLALVPLGMYQRVLRSDLGTAVQEDFILAARAKGMGQANLMFRQALRPSSLGALTLAGMVTAALIGGSVVIESIFALPGLGQVMVLSIANRDIVMIQALVLLIAVVYVVINMCIDILYRFVDPRISHGD